MADYGVLPEGFNRKPLDTTLTEIMNAMVTEFGPDVIQTAASPFGQLNGLMADLITELWEVGEDIYQSIDPDQAEGVRLDTLGSIRLVRRGTGETDVSFRQALTNEGQARIDLQDISRALAALDGVTYYHVWINDTGTLDENGMPDGTVCIAITGGDEDEIAEAIRAYIVPGVTTFGTTKIESSIDGYCRTFRILRPIDIPVTLQIKVRAFKDAFGCPPPSAEAIEQTFLSKLDLLNGDDISYYRVRSIIESSFSNVEVVSIKGSRDNIGQNDNEAVVIGFIERASLAAGSVTVEKV